MKKLFTILAFAVSAITFAQQDSIRSQYYFNTANPTLKDTILKSKGLSPSLSNQTSLVNTSANTSVNAATINSLNANFKNENDAYTIEGSNSPYEWKWVRDGIWTGAALGASYFGLTLIQDKDDLPESERAAFLNEASLQEKIDNINFLDRWVAGKHSENANSISDIPFAISFAAPFALLFDDEINDHTGQYIGMYIQSLATTASIYTITAGLVNRSRPYVYDNSGDTSEDRRFKNNGQRSFYSGHVAATATATFFAAKVYSDYNPDANGKVFVWAGAAALPAAVGVFRMEAGQHFLTDVLLGYALGGVTGILIPEMHKKKNDNIDIYPSSGTTFLGDPYRGMALSYRF
ncbi:phosphatase PAP2 family protein [Aequorivita echinoideorum]|uniref:Phosphatase PAP2 family protein n=1 Tax=Aequorivita echinoideorum TaxID=1549647 RepID=A0ABS5S6D4_9FLAO|nr:phosphatase PAP2 family protein [Aequorivita echinoideorum]MBT0608568.1 phosphatase PAP2 family protein [Aequorivita echinoideorum]